jgi:hypothetical protein
VEEVREQILDLVYENVISDFTDVAVYMPDPDKYLPHILRVFGAFPQSHPVYIPFSILGASGGSSLTARGLFALLGIAGGEFNRARVFELMRNPIVMASKNFSAADAEMWEEWVNEHGMFRGYDAEQRKSMGDAEGAATEEHTFKRGMERVFKEIDAAGDGTIPPDSTLYDLFKPNTPAAEIRKTAEKFQSLLEELNELSEKFTGNDSAAANATQRASSSIKTAAALDIHEAVEEIKKAVRSWFGAIPQDGSVDGGAEGRVRQEAIGGLDAITLQNTSAGRAGIGRDEFIALVRGCVPQELKMPQSAWHGVTFAPLRSSMVLPHRAIFVLGLDATAFPGTNEPAGWNLLASGRIVGDSDRVRDNRFAFLELMHAARKRLTLSFRARDIQKDEELQPSSVVLELEEYLKSQGLTDGNDPRKCLVRHEVPWVLHESLNAAQKRGRKYGTWDRVQRELAVRSAEKREKHRHDLTPPQTDPKTSTDCAGGRAVTLYDLKLFFGNPLEYHLRRTLNITGDEDDGDMQAVNEPAETGTLLGRLRKNVWTAVLRLTFSDGTDTNLTQSAAEEAGRIYDEHIDSGQAPEGHIRRMERAELLEWATKCAAEAKALAEEYFPKHRLIEKNCFTLPYEPFDVNVKYALTLVPKDLGDNSQNVGILAFDKDGQPRDNHALWLDGLAQWLTEIDDGTIRPVILVALNHSEEKVGWKTSKMIMNKSKLPDIENWLTGILSEMQTGTRCEHLPFKAVAAVLKRSEKECPDFKQRLNNLTSEELKKTILTGKYNPYPAAFKLTDAKPEEMDDEAMRKLIELRCAPILERWIHE